MPYSSSPSVPLSTHEPRNSNSSLSNSNYKPMLNNSKKHKENYRVIPSTLLLISIPPVIDTGLHQQPYSKDLSMKLHVDFIMASGCGYPSATPLQSSVSIHIKCKTHIVDLVFLLLLSSKLILVKPHFIFNLFYFYFSVTRT